MSNLNSKQIVMVIGIVMMSIGFVGIIGDSEQETSIEKQQRYSSQQPSLEVKKGNGLPASTIDVLQGSGGIQTQGTQPQGANAGASLQPNAGADSLPKNY